MELRVRKLKLRVSPEITLAFFLSASLMPRVFHNLPYYNYVDEGHVVHNIFSGFIRQSAITHFYGPTYLDIGAILALAASPIMWVFGLGELISPSQVTGGDFYQYFEPVWLLPMLRLISLVAFFGTLVVAGLIVRRSSENSLLPLGSVAALGLLPWYREYAVIALPEMVGVFLFAVSIYFFINVIQKTQEFSTRLLGITLALLVGVKIHYALVAFLFLAIATWSLWKNRSKVDSPRKLVTGLYGTFFVVSLTLFLLQDSLRGHFLRIATMFSYYESKTSSSNLFEVVFLTRLNSLWVLSLSIAILLGIWSLRSANLSWQPVVLSTAVFQFLFFASRDFTVDRNVAILPFAIIITLATLRLNRAKTDHGFTVSVALTGRATKLSLLGLIIVTSFSNPDLYSIRQVDTRIEVSEKIRRLNSECRFVWVEQSLQFRTESLDACRGVRVFKSQEFQTVLLSVGEGDFLLTPHSGSEESGKEFEYSQLVSSSSALRLTYVAEGRKGVVPLNFFNLNPEINVFVLTE